MTENVEETKERTDIPREEMYRGWAKENPDLLVKEAIGHFQASRDRLQSLIDYQCRLSILLVGKDEVLQWEDIIERVKKLSA